MWIVLISMLLLASPVLADVYKCPDGKGGKVLQSFPCPGEHEPFEARTNPATTDDHSSVVSLERLYRQWTDTVKVAESSSRIAMATPISTLQAIKREVEGLPVAECLVAPKQQWLKGMEESLAAFLGFMQAADREGWYTREQLKESEAFMKAYERGVSRCRQS